METMEKSYTVTILWGEDPETREWLTPRVYSFETEAELRAFMQGVDDACGYGGYDFAWGRHGKDVFMENIRNGVRLNETGVNFLDWDCDPGLRKESRNLSHRGDKEGEING